MKLNCCILILYLLNCCIYGAEIHGIVTDSKTGEPLAGANVYILGTGIGASTGLNGYYIIKNLFPGSHC